MAKISADDFFNTETRTNPSSKMSADDFFSTSTKEFESMEQKRIKEASKKILQNTLNSVTRPVAVEPTAAKPEEPKGIDFKAAQAAKKSAKSPSAFEGKTPIPITTPPKSIQETLKGKIPAAELLQPTGGGPANASKIPGISQYEINKKEIDKAPPVAKQYAQVMNYIMEGNPLGIAVNNAFSGNSGVTRKDSSGNKTVDKVSDVINNFVTPFLTPTGAPVGSGPNVAPYEAAGKVLNTGVGQKVVNKIASAIPKVKPETAQRIVNATAKETLAGPLQNVAMGLQQGQDSGKEIGMNAAYGAAGGLIIGGAGAALSEGLSSALSKIMKRTNRADDEVAATLEEIFTPKAELVAPNEMRTNLPEVNPTLNLPQSPERLALPQGRNTATTARIEQRPNVYRQKFEALIEEAKKRPFSPGREDIELENLWGQMAERTDPSLDELIELAYPKKNNVPKKGMVGAARANQEMREVAGVGNPVKSTAPQVFGDAAAPKQVLAKAGTVGTKSDDVIRPTTLSREQEIINKGKNLTQEDIDFALSDQWDNSKLFSESTLKESTYVKPEPKEEPLKFVPLGGKPKPIETKLQPKIKTQVKPEATTKIEPKPIKAEVKPKKLKTAVEEVDEAIEAVNEPKVRDKVYNYLDNAEKEARERIAKRRGQLNSTPIPEWTDYSIIMAAKLGKKTIKVTNFTEELVKEFGESVREHSAKILRMSREELRKQERAASQEGMDAATFNARPEGDADSFRAKISRDVPKDKKSNSDKWQAYRTSATDDLAVIEDVERTLNGGRNGTKRGGKLFSAEDSLYKASRMFKGVPERAAQIIDDRLTPVIRSIEKAGYTAEQLEQYALAVHARDVNKAGYKSGFTDQEIKIILNELESPEMIEAQQSLIKINRDMLKELVDSGVESKETFEVLGERWKNYIPLFRELESDKVGFEAGMSSALANVTTPLKTLKGSEAKVIAPLENMVKNIMKNVNASERNKVAQQIPKLADLDTEGRFFRKLDPGQEVGQKNVLKVKVEGKDVHYDVEPNIYKAIMNLDKESTDLFLRALSKPASILRAGATLTPEFAIRNPIRDINNAFIVSQSGFNPITDFGVGLIQTIKKGPLYKDWVDNLGAYGNTMSMDRKVHQKALEDVLKQPISKKFVNVVNGKLIIQALRAISDATESATKVGEYRAALRSGASKQEAAYRSRDIMDFARSGSSVRSINKAVSFFNANIQGKSKLIRAIKENPGGVITRGFVSVTLPTVGIFIANHKFASQTQKDTISNAPDWMKDSFWLMAIPGTDLVARIPKPFDFAAVFANLPEKALQYTLDNDPEAFEGYVRRTLASQALPTQISGLMPIYEGFNNFSNFKQGPIIPRGEQGLEYKDQFDPVRTSTTARVLASGVEKVTGGKGTFKNFSSPRIMDNTIQGLTAGLGKYASNAIDFVLDETGVFERATKPKKSLEQKPFVGAFLVDPNQGGKAMDEFYKTKTELTNEKASAKLNSKPFYEGEKLKKSDDLTDITRDITKAARKVDKELNRVRTKALTKQDQLDIVNDVSDAMSSINKAIKFIEKSDLSSAEKKSQISPLVKQRNDLVQRSNDYFKGKVIK